MLQGYRYERVQVSFWRELGLDPHAAKVAVKCFPESHDPTYNFGPYQNEYYTNLYGEYDNRAIDVAEKAPLAYRSDAKHPAFWICQGCDFDEAARRAVAAFAMVNLQLEATPPPPPPQPDRFAEIAQALLMQGAMQRRLEGPDSGSQSQEPFNPNDYPRLQSGRS